jgi:hypothetical protein
MNTENVSGKALLSVGICVLPKSFLSWSLDRLLYNRTKQNLINSHNIFSGTFTALKKMKHV